MMLHVQLLREFQRYKELIKRPSISKELVTERETLLGELTLLTKQIQEDFNQKASGMKETPKGKNLPESVNTIVWVKQLEAKVRLSAYKVHSLYCSLSQIKDTLNLAQSVLGDLSGFQKFEQNAHDLHTELEGWRKDQFDDWCRDLQAQINDTSNPLRYLGQTTNNGLLPAWFFLVWKLMVV